MHVPSSNEAEDSIHLSVSRAQVWGFAWRTVGAVFKPRGGEFEA
jgi:hypothetical protein